MAYTTINKSTDHFNTVLYTGNGSAGHAITGVGFAPDWTWIKIRSSGSHHTIFDRVRGATKSVNSDSDNAESTSSGHLTAFGSDGFTLGDNSGNGNTNADGSTYAAWNWKAGGAGSANTDGTINTTVSANTTAGFSIITYTGTGSAGTIGHGLGVKPDYWMVKARSETRSWYGWHKSMPLGDVWNLNSNGAKSTDTSLFTNTAPTTSVINLGTSVGTNNNGITFVCYAFAEKKGYSKFNSYIGNGNSNGQFIFTGFKPAYMLVKRIDGSDNWTLWDNKRESDMNPNNNVLFPSTNSAESTSDSSYLCDFLSNGIKWKGNSTGMNADGANYNYLAFAEAPLVGTNNIPCTAR